MKSKLTMTVIGNTPELIEFVRLCALIQSFGTYGMSRRITVRVDGDGSGRLTFFGDKGEDLPNIEHSDLDKLDSSKEGFTVDIGE